MQNQLLADGITLMLMGMGVVFVFLALLVLATFAMSRMILNYFPEPVAVPATSSSPDTSSDSLPSKRTLAIIQEALRQHRNR